MSYSEEVINQLAHFVMELGSVDLVHALPESAIIEALTHGDSSVVITLDDYLIELTDLVEGTGYSVFDPGMNFLYSVESPIAGEGGHDDADLALLVNPPAQQFFYLAYDQRDINESGNVAERLILVVTAHKSKT